MSKKTIWHDNQYTDNMELYWESVGDAKPDSLILTEYDDDRNDVVEKWQFEIMPKEYIDQFLFQALFTQSSYEFPFAGTFFDKNGNLKSGFSFSVADGTPSTPNQETVTIQWSPAGVSSWNHFFTLPKRIVSDTVVANGVLTKTVWVWNNSTKLYDKTTETTNVLGNVVVDTTIGNDGSTIWGTPAGGKLWPVVSTCAYDGRNVDIYCEIPIDDNLTPTKDLFSFKPGFVPAIAGENFRIWNWRIDTGDATEGENLSGGNLEISGSSISTSGNFNYAISPSDRLCFSFHYMVA